QPSRHLRDREPDHGAAARPERRRVRAREDHPAGGRRCDHGRDSDEGGRHSGDDRSVVVGTAQAVDPTAAKPDAAEENPGFFKRVSTNLRAGNLGVVPIVVGEIAIVIFFGFKATNFFTAVNFGNIIIQMAGTTMLAYGVVFVLLLGEIDLSIGYVAGIGALVVAELQLPGSGHQLNGLLAIVLAVAVCAVIGAGQGSIVAFVGVPSFVVTLAGYLIWQGVILGRLEVPGSIII